MFALPFYMLIHFFVALYKDKKTLHNKAACRWRKKMRRKLRLMEQAARI